MRVRTPWEITIPECRVESEPLLRQGACTCSRGRLLSVLEGVRGEAINLEGQEVGQEKLRWPSPGQQKEVEALVPVKRSRILSLTINCGRKREKRQGRRRGGGEGGQPCVFRPLHGGASAPSPRHHDVPVRQPKRTR